MQRLTSYKYVVLHTPRKYLRLRTVIFITYISLLASLAMVIIKLHGLGDGKHNRAPRRDGMLSREGPYGGALQPSLSINKNNSHQHLLEWVPEDETLYKTITIEDNDSVDGGGRINDSTNKSQENHDERAQVKYKSILGLHDRMFFKDIINQSIGCEEIATLKLTRHVGRGTTKDVYASTYKDKHVAVKMVSPDVQDIKACMRRKKIRRKEECYVYANYKIMKEIALAHQLHHPNIVQLIGYCIQDSPLFSPVKDHGVISVVEFGAKASLQRLATLSWTQRLQVSISLADLLDYLEHSPLGSIAIWDYKHSQFIITEDNLIKYSDLDDISADEPECVSKEQCLISNSNHTKVNCVHSRCLSHNAKFNLIKTTKQFLRPLLLQDTPTRSQKTLDDMFEQLKHLRIDARKVKTILLKIRDQLKY